MQLNESLAEISAKLDKLIELLTHKEPAKEEAPSGNWLWEGMRVVFRNGRVSGPLVRMDNPGGFYQFTDPDSRLHYGSNGRVFQRKEDDYDAIKEYKR